MHKETIKIGDTELIFETGRMAKQANGAVLATFGGSVVLATVCCSSDTREGLDFVPLSVEYNEKYYAAGKSPGVFSSGKDGPRTKKSWFVDS
jgi:polyribonucleotide nucleotidyltransferase